MNLTASQRWLIGAATVAAALIYQAYKIHSTLTQRARAQEQVTESMLQWRQGFQAISSSMKTWNQSFKEGSEIQDLLGLIDQLGLDRAGLQSDTDKVFVSAVKPVKHNNTELGLAKVCLASGSANGLLVTAQNYTALIEGVRALVARPQIYVGSVVIRGEKAQPEAELGDLCVLLRSR